MSNISDWHLTKKKFNNNVQGRWLGVEVQGSEQGSMQAVFVDCFYTIQTLLIIIPGSLEVSIIYI